MSTRQGSDILASGFSLDCPSTDDKRAHSGSPPRSCCMRRLRRRRLPRLGPSVPVVASRPVGSCVTRVWASASRAPHMTSIERQGVYPRYRRHAHRATRDTLARTLATGSTDGRRTRGGGAAGRRAAPRAAAPAREPVRSPRSRRFTVRRSADAATQSPRPPASTAHEACA